MAQTPTVFISHSAKDLQFVKSELIPFLKERNIRSWYSEESILPSRDFATAISEGLKKSEWFLLVMSRHSEESDWVKIEVNWAHEHRRSPMRIVPLQIAECNVEKFHPFLGQIEIIDFRSDPTAARRKLHALWPRTHPSQLERVQNLVGELESTAIKIPLQPPINLVGTLRALPRKGKLLRIKKHNLDVECRSVLDHVMSIAHTSDLFLEYLRHGLSSREMPRLAQCITFHDLNEVLIDDYPAYTDTGDLLGFRRTRKELDVLEQAANALIKPWLDQKLSQDFDEAITIMSGQDSVLLRFVRVIDKIDPIIAIWRYIYFYRHKLRDISYFLRAMDHFFLNPHVREVCEESDIDADRVCKMVDFMQDVDNARRYYSDVDVLNEMAEFAEIDTAMPRLLIEGRVLQFVPQRARKRSRAGRQAAKGVTSAVQHSE